MAMIIRKDNACQSPSSQSAGGLKFNFADIEDQADDYLKTVQREAAKIVQRAHQQAEQIRRQSEVAGRKAAEAAVERILDEKVARRMDTLLPALEQLTQQISDTRGELQSHWERTALQVATAIAQRIIRREIARQPEIAMEVIAETLRLAAGSAEIVVRVNPTDYENLGPQIDRLAATLCRLTPSAIVTDPAITPGGCRVQTKLGEIDQTIESQLRRIEQDLE
jgi:flagellar assembly protein FliH